MKERKLGLVIFAQMILGSHSFSHDVKICLLSFINLSSECIWLLVWGMNIIVISWEWVESSHNMPSSAKLWISISDESTNVSSWERNTSDVVSHNTCHRLTQWELLRVVVSKPLRCIFSNTGRGASFNDHWSLLLAYKPIWRSLRLHSSPKRVSIKLKDLSFFPMNSFQRNGSRLKTSFCWHIW